MNRCDEDDRYSVLLASSQNVEEQRSSMVPSSLGAYHDEFDKVCVRMKHKCSRRGKCRSYEDDDEAFSVF